MRTVRARDNGRARQSVGDFLRETGRKTGGKRPSPYDCIGKGDEKCLCVRRGGNRSNLRGDGVIYHRKLERKIERFSGNTYGDVVTLSTEGGESSSMKKGDNVGEIGCVVRGGCGTRFLPYEKNKSSQE